MPAHLYLRTGRWAAGIQASEKALSADALYIARCLHPYAHGHNLRMGGWHAKLAGAREKALRFARAHREDAQKLSSFGMHDRGSEGVSGSSGEEALSLTRFGNWEAIRALPTSAQWCHDCPNDATHRAARAYAAGMAAEAIGASSDAALAELRSLAVGEGNADSSSDRAVAGPKLMLLELEVNCV